MERTIKELLILLRNEIKDKKILLSDMNVECGLCCVIRKMYASDKISGREFSVLYDYIKEYRPYLKSNPDYAFWPGLVAPRVKWLNKKIKEL